MLNTGILQTNDKSKANILNDYFVSISIIDDTDVEVPDVELRTDVSISDIPFQ